MRRGDFSELLAQNILIYDPNTAQQVGGRVVRTPFPGNIIPTNRLSPIAQQLQKYYPLPNQAGNLGTNNYFSTNPRTDDFYSISTRVDHRLTDKQQVFVRYTRNNRKEARGAYFGEVNGIVPTGNFLFRINDGVTADHVYTISSKSVLDIRAGWQRFQEPSVRQHEGLVDPATLGFTPNVTALFGGAQYFPLVDVGGFSGLGDNLAGSTTHSIYSFQPTLTRIMGSHAVRVGLRRAAVQGSRRQPQPRGRRLHFPRELHEAPGQFHHPVRAVVRQFPSRAADGRKHRPQRRAAEPHDVPRRVRSGRLEGLEPSHRQPRAPLRVRGVDDGSRQPERERIRPECVPRHHGGGESGLRGQPDRAAAGVGVQPDRRAAVRIGQPIPASGTRTRTTSSRASGSRTS